MAGYIGTIPVPQATESRSVFTATSNQTTFATGGYTPNLVSVFLNGVHLARADFVATNGTDVVLAVGAAADDTVEILAFNAFEASSSAFTADVSTSGTFLPEGDTAAGDDAAVGYTAAEGLILTGQGSTSDVTIKNDADATVMSIPTGTTGATFAGVVTANAGVVVDNITLDGTTIALSSGSLILDAAGDITLDADGGDIRFKDGGTEVGAIVMDDGNNTLIVQATQNDADIKFTGKDNNSGITALTLDMSAAGAATFNSTVTRSLTRGSIDVGNSSGVSTPLAKGAAGTFLTSDGTDLSFAAAGGGLDFIASTDASSAASVSFTGFDANKYDSYLFTFAHVLPATDGVFFIARVSVDGGSNYLAASDSYTYQNADISGVRSLYQQLGNNLATDGGFNGTLTVTSPQINAPTFILFDGVGGITNGNIDAYGLQGYGAGRTKAATVVNAIQFLMASGNVASGTITMYGMVNA